MIEYPSIIGPSKAPRKPCIAFEKFDGSNIRVKYTPKQGFCLFGSRTQLIDESHPHLGQAIAAFRETHEYELVKAFKFLYPNEKEINVFGEFFGPNSFAGLHNPEDPKRFVMFDIMFVRKGQNEFLSPQEFTKEFDGCVPIPNVVYRGNFNEQLIKDVREGKYPVGEGVVAKGTEKTGAARGKIWMAKIKTNAYLEKLRNRFGSEWKKYAE